MAPRAFDVALLAPYVVASAALGSALLRVGLSLFRDLLADLIFVVGSVAAGVAAYRIALSPRERRVEALMVAALLTWLTYAAAYARRVATMEDADGAALAALGYWPLLAMLLFLTAPGWIFAAVAPVVLARRRRAS